MCYSEVREEIGSSQYIFDIKGPMIFLFYSSLFADVFNIFKIQDFVLCSFVSWSTIFHGFGSCWHYSKPRWAFYVLGFCYKFEILSKLPQICQIFLDKLL